MRGLSAEELSARTKIKIERMRAIEAMDWRQLPRLVYLKGFLRAYAVEVQLDPDAVTDRYLNELNEVAPEYANREAHPPPVPVEQFPVRESIWDRDPDDDDLYAMDVLRDAPLLPARETTPEFLVIPSPTRGRVRRLLPVAIVGLVALAAGWVIGSNLQQVVRAVTAAAAGEPPQAEDSATETNEERLERARQRATAMATEMGTTPPVAASLVDPVPVPFPEPVSPAIDPSTGYATAVESQPPDVATLDVSGWWALTNRPDSSAADTLNDLNSGFHLQLQQNGNHVTGTGVKWMENGRSIPSDSRIAIQVEGIVNARRLELNVTERGATAGRAGKFVMNVTGADTLRGRFVTAANARGVALARRMESPGR